MNPLDYRFEYRRRLPHSQPLGATFFVTFRLHGSIPIEVLREWQEEKRLEERRGWWGVGLNGHGLIVSM